MRTSISEYGVTLWLSARDTADWSEGVASWGNGSWPCTSLRGRPLCATFDKGGLVDMAVNYGRGEQNIDGDEFNAITADALTEKLPENHPAHFAAVGQFQHLTEGLKL